MRPNLLLVTLSDPVSVFDDDSVSSFPVTARNVGDRYIATQAERRSFPRLLYFTII